MICLHKALKSDEKSSQKMEKDFLVFTQSSVRYNRGKLSKDIVVQSCKFVFATSNISALVVYPLLKGFIFLLILINIICSAIFKEPL